MKAICSRRSVGKFLGIKVRVSVPIVFVNVAFLNQDGFDIIFQIIIQFLMLRASVKNILSSI